MASKAMKLKLSGKVKVREREVSPRKQVGEAEDMMAEKGPKGAWWRDVGMEEGM
jgi:pyruvate dehydrogenase kinase 2/3/4